MKNFAHIAICDEEAEAVYNVIHSHEAMVGYFDLKFTSEDTKEQSRIWDMYISGAWNSVEEEKEALEFLSACLKKVK